MDVADFSRSFRFGFGHPGAGSFDPEGEITKAAQSDSAISADVRERMLAVEGHRQAIKDSGNATAERDKLKERLRRLVVEDAHRAIVAAVESPLMFTSRLSAFWANHFTFGGNAIPIRASAGLYEPGILRPLMMGSFEELLIKAELFPAMVAYLNLQESFGPNSVQGKRLGRGMNENLGREILELHTLGADGGYTQNDVFNLAKLLTGWHIDAKVGEVAFDVRRAEPGKKELLGQSFGGKEPRPEDLLQAFKAIAGHPSTARFISRKLATHFFGAESQGIAKVLEKTFRATGGALAAVYRAMLSLKEASAKPGAMARNDYEFLVCALRAGELRKGALDLRKDRNGVTRHNPITSGAMSALTQELWRAPSPKGWPEDPAFWLSPGSFPQRLKRIPVIVRNYEDQDPIDFAERTLGPLMTKNTLATLRFSSNRLQSLGLVLASPEFNRR